MKSKLYCSFLLLFFISAAFAQMPDTDIWLMDIKVEMDTVLFSNSENITKRVGYDNQPAFSPDGKYLLYTSMRDEKQTDIFKYDLETRTISQFTKTKTSEYSPSFMPDGKNISVVMVEKDSAQRIWKFPIKGGKASLLDLKTDSIGYHTWLSEESLTLWRLGEPPTLWMASTTSGIGKLEAKNIGRCVLPTEDKKGYYYTLDQLAKDSTWQLKDSRFPNKNSLSFPASTQDFCYYTDTEIPPVVIYACNSIIWAFYKDTMETMCRFDMKDKGIKKITRMTLSVDKKKIAIVAE